MALISSGVSRLIIEALLVRNLPNRAYPYFGPEERPAGSKFFSRRFAPNDGKYECISEEKVQLGPEPDCQLMFLREFQVGILQDYKRVYRLYAFGGKTSDSSRGLLFLFFFGGAPHFFIFHRL